MLALQVYRTLTEIQKDKVRGEVSGTCSPEFWTLWNDRKDEIKAIGITCGKIGFANRWIAVIPFTGEQGLIAALKADQGK